eukprot:956578-Amorphochlora_amoeboformis.AAC.2
MGACCATEENNAKKKAVELTSEFSNNPIAGAGEETAQTNDNLSPDGQDSKGFLAVNPIPLEINMLYPKPGSLSAPGTPHDIY